MKSVSVLITFDVDPAPRLEEGIDKSLVLLEKAGIPATFFFTAASADASMVAKVLAGGHEVGCHGLNHDESEELDRLSEAEQRDLLTKATGRLRDLANGPILSFRSPRVKISAATLKVLEELGYAADSSVCSQRLDVLSSNLVNPGWLIAPRRPYHPSASSPYRKGNSKILEVPVSAAVLPFISTALRIFGVSFMKLLFKLLAWESRITGKPVVYLMHPHEFLYAEKKSFHWRMLIPDRSWRVTGFPIRRWLSRQRLGPEVYEMNERLLIWIAKQGVSFLTVKNYLKTVRIDP